MARFRVCLITDQRQYQAEGDERTTLLEVIGASGLTVRQACQNGVCGICRCRLVSGDVTYRQRKPHALWREEIDQGYILPCIAFAASDLSLDEFLPAKN